MSNYFKNKLKDRLTYCKDWKHSIDMYLANKEITKQANEEFYKTRPFLKFVLTFNFRNRANIYHTLNKADKNIIVLRNNKEVTLFLSQLI